MTERHRSGKFKARPAREAAPLLAPDADELTRAARMLSTHAHAATAAKRTTRTIAHLATFGPYQRGVWA